MSYRCKPSVTEDFPIKGHNPVRILYNIARIFKSAIIYILTVLQQTEPVRYQDSELFWQCPPGQARFLAIRRLKLERPDDGLLLKDAEDCKYDETFYKIIADEIKQEPWKVLNFPTAPSQLLHTEPLVFRHVEESTRGFYTYVASISKQARIWTILHLTSRAGE